MAVIDYSLIIFHDMVYGILLITYNIVHMIFLLPFKGLYQKLNIIHISFLENEFPSHAVKCSYEQDFLWNPNIVIKITKLSSYILPLNNGSVKC